MSHQELRKIASGTHPTAIFPKVNDFRGAIQSLLIDYDNLIIEKENVEKSNIQMRKAREDLRLELNNAIKKFDFSFLDKQNTN